MKHSIFAEAAILKRDAALTQTSSSPMAHSDQSQLPPDRPIDSGFPHTELIHRLERIEAILRELVGQRMIKEWYTTEEVAEILQKAPFTVREWCRQRRVKAAKRDCGRGNTREWVISHDELSRIRNEGLLPVDEY